MLVMCTVVLLIQHGTVEERRVQELVGTVVKTSGLGEKLLVDFGHQIPTPEVRKLNENDCLYLKLLEGVPVEQLK